MNFYVLLIVSGVVWYAYENITAAKHSSTPSEEGSSNTDIDGFGYSYE